MINTDLCAAACAKIDGPAYIDLQGKIQGTAFPMKPAALLMSGILPFSVQPPRCKGTSCRMKLPGTRSHGILVQTRSPQAQSKYKHGGKLPMAGKRQTETPDVYSKQATATSGCSSMVPLGLFKWMWKDGHSYWCHMYALRVAHFKNAQGWDVRQYNMQNAPQTKLRQISGNVLIVYWKTHQQKSFQVQADKVHRPRQ